MKFKNKLLISSAFLLCGLVCACNQATSSSPKETIATDDVGTTTLQKVSYSQNPEISKYRITSNILGYDLQYWVQIPSDYSADQQYPTLYLTDGLSYKNNGLSEIAIELMETDKIDQIILIYVGAVDPDNNRNNRRNSQFLCNPKYVEFFRDELVLEVDENFNTNTHRDSRGILGLSFGGLNSMYFGIHANDVFGKIGIQSPAPHPCPDIYNDFTSRDKLPIDIFLSTGTVNDKARDTRKFKGILEGKDYEFAYHEVPEGHNWKNWAPLLDDVLLHFYGKDQK